MTSSDKAVTVSGLSQRPVADVMRLSLAQMRQASSLIAVMSCHMYSGLVILLSGSGAACNLDYGVSGGRWGHPPYATSLCLIIETVF